MEADELIARTDQLIQRQVDAAGSKITPQRFQPGEDPSSTYREDAAHWAAVYTELAAFKRQLLADVERKIATTSAPAVADELTGDLQLLSVEYERICLHQEFWRARL